jgi:hypothetical protein
LYPELSQLDKLYTENLKTPEGFMKYEQLFNRAVSNIVHVWTGIDNALSGKDKSFLDGLEDWNLDTGRSVSTGKYVFWRN